MKYRQTGMYNSMPKIEDVVLCMKAKASGILATISQKDSYTGSYRHMRDMTVEEGEFEAKMAAYAAIGHGEYISNVQEMAEICISANTHPRHIQIERE